MFKARTQRERRPRREPISQIEPRSNIHAQHHVFAAHVIQAKANVIYTDVFGHSAAVLGPQTAQPRKAQPESSGDVQGSEVLGGADLGGGKPLRPRRYAEGMARIEFIERAVVGNSRVTLDPASADGELSSLKLRQRGRIPKYRRRNVLRQGKTHPSHAAGRGRQNVLRIGSVALAHGRMKIHD